MNPRKTTGSNSNARAYLTANKGRDIDFFEFMNHLGLTKVQTYGVIRRMREQGYCEAGYVIRSKAQP